MNRLLPHLMASLLALGTPFTAARADALEQLLAQQRNGLWEVRASGSLIQLARTATSDQSLGLHYVCVTDDEKVQAGKEVRTIIADGTCRPLREEFRDGHLAASAVCRLPGFGEATIDQQGWSKPAAFRVETRVSTGAAGLFGQSLEAVTEGRWLRACAAHERPGLQPPR